MARSKHLPKRLTRDEAAALLEQPNRRVPTGIRDAALLRVYYRCGLRCSEALDLRSRDLHLARSELRVNAGKGDKDRVVWMDPVTVSYLERWRDVRPKSEWFFCTLKGERMSDSHVRHMVARRGAKAGIEIRVHPHQLRHSFASELLEEGYTISAVQKLLGHERLDTTQVYLHLVDEKLREDLISRPG
jgi:site-specific recombinase XerD